jgi:hypothetical protein
MRGAAGEQEAKRNDLASVVVELISICHRLTASFQESSQSATTTSDHR